MDPAPRIAAGNRRAKIVQTMLTIRVFPILLVAVCAPPAFSAQAYVTLCCSPAGSISSFNPQTNQIAGTFFTLPGAVDMVLSPDGSKAYVATSSSVLNSASNSLGVYQLPGAKLVQRIALPDSPTEIAINAAGDHVYAAAVETKVGVHRVLSIDLPTGQVTAAALPNTTAFALLPIAVSPDGSTLYVGSATQKTLTLLNAATLAQTGSIAMTGITRPAPLAITPDGQNLCAIVSASDGRKSALDIVNLATQNVTAVTLQSAAVPFGMVLSADGATVYVNGSQVFAVDVATGAIVGSANTGSQNPYRIAITPDGASLYATDLTDSITSVVSTATLTVAGTLDTLANVYAIAFTPQGQGYVFYQEGSAAVRVDTSSMKAVGRVAVGGGPTQVAATANGGEAFVLNGSSGNLSAVSQPATATRATPVSIGLLVEGMALLGDSLYVLSSGATLNSVNPATLQVSAPIELPLPSTSSTSEGTIAASPVAPDLFIPYLTLNDEGATGGGLMIYNTPAGSAAKIGSGRLAGAPMAVSPDGTHVYEAGFLVGSAATFTLLDFDIPALSLAQTSGFSSTSYTALAVSNDGSTLYAVDRSGRVDLIDTSTLAVTGSITAGVAPSGIALSADGTQALLSDSTSTSITVLDLVDNTVAGAIAVGAPSSAVAYLN